jgi:hypothetical protein
MRCSGSPACHVRDQVPLESIWSAGQPQTAQGTPYSGVRTTTGAGRVGWEAGGGPLLASLAASTDLVGTSTSTGWVESATDV